MGQRRSGPVALGQPARPDAGDVVRGLVGLERPGVAVGHSLPLACAPEQVGVNQRDVCHRARHAELCDSLADRLDLREDGCDRSRLTASPGVLDDVAPDGDHRCEVARDGHEQLHRWYLARRSRGRAGDPADVALFEHGARSSREPVAVECLPEVDESVRNDRRIGPRHVGLRLKGSESPLRSSDVQRRGCRQQRQLGGVDSGHRPGGQGLLELHRAAAIFVSLDEVQEDRDRCKPPVRPDAGSAHPVKTPAVS